MGEGDFNIKGNNNRLDIVGGRMERILTTKGRRVTYSADEFPSDPIFCLFEWFLCLFECLCVIL